MAFKQAMNIHFTMQDFDKYMAMTKKELVFYKEFIPPGGRILDIGCGLGCTAIPLSRLGFEVVGIDNDPQVMAAAHSNAKRLGKNIRILNCDINKIDQIFRRDSFAASMSGGVLEHFPKQEIREILKKQLMVAPVVISSMPIAVGEIKDRYLDYSKRICLDGFYRNLWTADEWLSDVLKGFNVVKHKTAKAAKAIGGFDELIVVIKRSKAESI